jgi:hypothetical protein
VQWNFNLLNGNTDDPNWNDTKFDNFFYDRKGNPVSISVRGTLLLPYFFYQYDTQKNWLAP